MGLEPGNRAPVSAGDPNARYGSKGGAEAGVTSSPLTDVFPITESIVGGMVSIPIPVGVVGPAGASAWWPLLEWKASTSFGQGVNLYAIDYSLSSSNNADANPVGAGEAPWGNSKIGGAAIVVGMNLPVAPLATPIWNIGVSGIPGIDTAATRVIRTDARFMDVQMFPAGSFNDSIPLRLEKTRSFAPYVYRVMQEQTIQVALVLRGDQVIAGAGGSIDGFAKVAISIGIVENTLGLPSI